MTRGRLLGQPGRGYLQVGSLNEYPPIAQGYSGGAAVDVGSGRVVGMIAQVVDAHRVAWMIPLATIASRWPPLREYLPKGLQADQEFRRAYDELRHAHYADALYRFGEVSKSYPCEADIYYYRVLAALGGRRPGGYQGAVIQQMEQMLDYALLLQPNSPHVQALLRLVEEDYYGLRGLKPRKIRSYFDIEEISPVHAREIADHVAAHECRTWQFLSARPTDRRLS